MVKLSTNEKLNQNESPLRVITLGLVLRNSVENSSMARLDSYEAVVVKVDDIMHKDHQCLRTPMFTACTRRRLTIIKDLSSSHTEVKIL